MYSTCSIRPNIFSRFEVYNEGSYEVKPLFIILIPLYNVKNLKWKSLLRKYKNIDYIYNYIKFVLYIDTPNIVMFKMLMIWTTYLIPSVVINSCLSTNIAIFGNI